MATRAAQLTRMVIQQLLVSCKLSKKRSAKDTVIAMKTTYVVEQEIFLFSLGNQTIKR